VGPRAGLDDVEKRKFLNVPGLELRPLGTVVLRRDGIVPNTHKKNVFRCSSVPNCGQRGANRAAEIVGSNLFFRFMFICWQYLSNRLLCSVDKVTDYTRQRFEFPAGEGNVLRFMRRF
jgi:hypothetical protein